MTPDYIIVGSGPAGSALAARLSEDPSTSVLLLEAGGPDSALKIAMPAALPFVYQDKSLSWNEPAGPEPHLNGLSIDEKRGHVLGGGTSINAMIFNRGNPRDFDGWAGQGLKGWGWADVLPYFKKMESFSEGGAARGTKGPVKVSRASARHKLFDVFMRAGEQAGHARPQDHNSGDQEGMHIAQSLIHKGRRCNAVQAYLKPARHRANLAIRTGALVERVLFDADRAVGVLLADGSRLMAGREVILAASTVGAAKLLLSGVGPADELRALGIPVVLDQPHVGRNLENHPGVNLQYTAPYEDSLVSELGPLGKAKLGLEWALFRRGLGASNIFEAGAFLKTHPSADYANVQFEFLPLYRRLVGNKLKVYPGFQMWIDLSRPSSRGHVRLPYLKDPERLAFRPEGKGYSGGVPTLAEPRAYNMEADHDYFENVVWPALAHRFPKFERTKCKSTLPGLYDQNDLDGNVIIGPGADGLGNFHMLAGFSGHGLMHAPGCGRAMAELILKGRYETIDLTRFGWQRVADGAPLAERGII